MEKFSLYVYKDKKENKLFGVLGADLNESISRAQGRTALKDREFIDFVLQGSLKQCLNQANKHKATII